MTKADAARLVGIIVTAYPNFDKFRDASAIEATVNLWAAMFAEDSAAVVGLAVKKHISVSKWPPSVADLREIITEMQHPELIPPDEAWGAVSDLLSSAGSHVSDPYACLPALVARAAEIIGWHNLYEMSRGRYGDSKPGMDRTVFMQQYTAMYEREKARAMTPAAVNGGMQRIAANTPDQSRRMLADLQQGRIDHDNVYRRLCGQPDRIAITVNSKRAIEDQEESQWKSNAAE